MSPERTIEENLEAEIVIIGGGGAGLAGAAAEEGVTGIIVLEKRGLGGNSAMSQGLFAAGVTTSGWQGDVYCYELAGSTLGFAINSGHIAGEGAARFISGEGVRKMNY